MAIKKQATPEALLRLSTALRADPRMADRFRAAYPEAAALLIDKLSLTPSDLEVFTRGMDGCGTIFCDAWGNCESNQ